jgi:lysylphosphatidylglycerol synthetase-like protein (DUF2156 family)
MSDVTPAKSHLWTIVAVIGACAIFVLILVVAYLPQKAAPVAEGSKTPEERAAILAEHRANARTLTSTYGWVDQQKGVVRLPVDRAVELTIQELNAGKK